jgi:ATP adenylyltransferase
MDRLWTPWRLDYVTEASEPHPGCIFCEAVERATAEPLVVYAGRAAFIILNKFPYNNGHLMVVPNRHIASLAQTTADEREEIMRFTRLAEIALTEAYGLQGLNVGINLGRAAGAGIADHLHVHLVPRWAGDTNFMSVVGDTRVLPEDLAATKHRLQPIFERLVGENA